MYSGLVFDVLVAGGGHAGIEAASAAARLGCKTALLTMDAQAIGRMSCNPAIGGLAKGQIVRDVDAMGGHMGLLADQAGIHFRMLNASKGPAVWGPRAQQDMDLYSRLACVAMETQNGLSVLQGELGGLEPNQSGFDLELLDGQKVHARKVIITSGTFLGAVMHVGESQSVGGRVGEPSAENLARTLKNMGIRTRRLKTGTPARLDESSLDFSQMEAQPGDEEPWAFSSQTTDLPGNQVHCWIAHTNALTHQKLSEGFDRSPMFTGKIQGLGPRYCPSIEDKITRFAEKQSHQLFLEPEGLGSGRIYVNGFSSSLPQEVQDAALRTIPGLADCKVLRYGYAVEYDSVLATDLHPTLEHKSVPGLYFAGQVNGTSGYEEAAGQGLMAGANAALAVQNRPPFLLGRADSYIGVMIDDLVRLDIPEPYRMFTSRAEFRLRLRHDNAEERLTPKAREIGLIDDDRWQNYQDSQKRILGVHNHWNQSKVSPQTANPWLESLGEAPLKEPTKPVALLKRPGAEINAVLTLTGLDPQDLHRRERLHIYAEALYEGFFERQERDVERLRKLENMSLPRGIDYTQIPSLTKEAAVKLSAHQPLTLGLAQGIPGVRPSDISILIHYLNAQTKDSE